MTIEELKTKLLELQEELEDFHDDMSDEVYGSIYTTINEDESVSIVNYLRRELISYDSYIFEQIFELISKLK